MVFSSFPVYLDHPNLHQFQQQAHHDHHQGAGIDSSQLPPQPPPQSVGGAGGSIRPGSMVDRARIAKLPLPEAGLKCPRCDSTNTKFCYFNNYSLTQPRHFCKTCRRYWTRGGALRNVPVGGGCRRNKKSKSSSSKSSTSNSDRQIGNNSTTTASPSSCSTDMVAHFPQPSSQLPLMAALQNLNHYGAAGGPMGSSIGGFQAQMVAAANGNGLAHMGFNLGPGNGNDLSTGGPDQWRLPSMGGFDATTNLFPFHSDQGSVEASSSMIGDHHQLGSMATSSGISQMASVKSEENQAGLNLTKQFFVNSDSNQFWGTASPWTGFSGINSSSTSHLL